jgi:3'(2'), 5'-bisphosphate nucleotidase
MVGVWKMKMNDDLVKALLVIARDAGKAIMKVYQQDFSVAFKDDKSPLTAADMAAHHIIEQGLNILTPGIPVLSEESADIPWTTRKAWTRYWLVDPLDGTREFVKKNGEFTVNIALVEEGRAIFGVIYAPALDVLWWGDASHGASMQQGVVLKKITTEKNTRDSLRVAASRSHLDETTAAALKRMGGIETLSMGSSLKFCRIAEAALDVYPRFAPTSEWDTAAGQAILEAAGGVVLNLDGSPFRYNTKESLLNPHFIALAHAALPWRSWLHD